VSKSKRKLKRPNQPQPQNEPVSADAPEGGPEAAPVGEIAAPQPPKPVSKPKKGAKSEPYKAPIDPDQPHKFKRSPWLHFIRYPAAGMLALLNVAIVMSFIERLPRHQNMDPFRELFFFGAVGFVDVFLFMPIVFEVNRIETDKDGLKLSTLLWKTRLKWEQITKFEQPKYLKFAILCTPKSFYLLNKYHLKPFFELAEIISAKMPAQIPDSKS